MVRNANALSIQGQNLVLSRDVNQREILFASFKPAGLRIQAASKTGEWRVMEGEGKIVARFHARDLWLSGENLKVRRKRLPEQIRLVLTDRGIDGIAELDLETYLAGVLPSEMSLSWPLEALKAQAIAARSYLVSSLTPELHFDVEDSVRDQVFKVYPDREFDREEIRNRDQALAQTEGLVLISPKGTVVRAFYHAHCGGKTTRASDVWPGTESMGTARDPFCERKGSWKASLTREELSSGTGFSHIKQVEVAKRDFSGRVSQVNFVLENGVESLSSQTMRLNLGFDLVRSADFEVEQGSKQIVFRGLGFGHGVGMCQHGSRILAIRGKSAESILKHYFPRARIAHLSQIKTLL